MAFLTATRFSALLSLTLGFELFQIVTRRWPAAVSAVLGNLVFEGLYLGLQRPDEIGLYLKQGTHCRFTMLICGVNVVSTG